MTAPTLHPPKLLNCPECETPLTGKYCHECGEKPPDAHDLTLKHFFHHGLHEFTHLDSKIFRTLRALVFKPGTLTAEYLAGRRNRYVLPLRLFVVLFAVNFFLYTRPGVTLYDVRVIISANPQTKLLERKLEHAAEKRKMTKEMLFEQLNETWQHDLSFFQLGDVFFFAVFLAALNWRRYFVEHLIFSLHAFSFVMLFGGLTWIYYWHYGFRQNWALFGVAAAVYLTYLWLALPKVYKTTRLSAFFKAILLVVGMVISRGFVVSFTLLLAIIQTAMKH